MPIYLVTRTETYRVVAEDDREAKVVAEEMLDVLRLSATSDVSVEIIKGSTT